jgi:DNA polymerase elongation subunit (family B)
MAHVLQPCDWYEHDNKGQYVIDVFGRLDDESVACLRITGFKPYFYVKGPRPDKPSSEVERYDVMAGFDELKPIKVWKVECESMKEFREQIKSVKGVLYESNLPPFLRMFHQRHIGPGSPIKFDGKKLSIPCDRETDEPLYNIDGFYECSYTRIEPSEMSIPMLVASYDLEMYSESGLFPRANEGDPIVQIGVSYRWSDDMLTPVKRTVFVNGTVAESDDPEIDFIECESEEDMLCKFAYEIRDMNPDVMCGYNTFGFDDAYIEDRCKQLGIDEQINFCRSPPMKLFQNGQWKTKFSETKKFELASGKYDLRFLMMRGRLGLDLLLNMRREHSLDSFKLDSVASVFLRDKVLKYEGGRIHTKSTRGLSNGNYIRFDIVGNTSDPYRDGYKFTVSDVQPKSFKVNCEGLFNDLSEKDRGMLQWTFTKDDIDHHDLFRLHKGTAEDRAVIAKYCIQDCDLVLTLMAKLDTIVNARGMADVCKVPMEYVLRRGQGIKIFSAVVYYASQRNQIIQTQTGGFAEEDGGYEGAIVISPKIGMYLDQPISVLDFNSLYPTNMISYNISPDTLVCERTFSIEGHKLAHYGLKMERIAELEEKGYRFDEIEYDNKDEKGVVQSITKCTYLQPSSDKALTTGILPKTLDILLKKRKEFKGKMEDMSFDEAQRSVFNGLQLAYKVVANSVYGQTGSRTSPIRKLCVAACTTAAGRKQLYFAKSVVEKEFSAEVIYGDTDSIFIKFPSKDLAECINMGIQAGNRITELCRKPYKIAYEKTLFPFILFCRKRYVGMLYEEDPNAKPKRKEMGIVLKRRDNAPIVKDVFGGALDILLKERDVKKAQTFVNEMLLKVLENKIPLEKFIVTKSLRDDYKTPDQIAHRVLADRMAKRDPGTAPKVGDRIPYIYVAENKKASKQGDRIEHLDYVRANKLTPDTAFYITNQIQNPVAQLFALCIDELEGYKPRKYELKKEIDDEEDRTLAILDLKEKELDKIMFLESPKLAKVIKASVRGPMDSWLSQKK